MFIFVSLLLSLLIRVTITEFTFEPVLLAHKPKGFTTYITVQEDIQEYRFIARVNGRTIFSWVTKKDKDGRWSYHNRHIKLNIGDEIVAEITVWTLDKIEYNKNITWTTLYYTPLNGNCMETQTLTPGLDKKLCGSDLIFEENFDNGNLNHWSIEQYIPQYSEDNYEFVSYQDIPETKFISDSRLFIKPVLRSPEEMNGVVDLKEGCTRVFPEACYHKNVGPFIVPPIKSARILSKFSFRYGRIEIGAKLPVGDWIYPQVELVPNHISKKYPKIVIAYSRGNTKLTLENGEEIGNSILYGGFASDYKEPGRSENLRKKIITDPNKEIKTYSVVWTPDMLFLVYDNDVYGRVPIPNELSDFRIALGVGVGGNFDFPDKLKSTSGKKPWFNNDAKQARSFCDAKDQWFSTWHENNVALQVDFIRIYAL